MFNQQSDKSSRDAINIALQNGLKLLNTMFEKVTIELDDDSDDDTEENRKRY